MKALNITYIRRSDSTLILKKHTVPQTHMVPYIVGTIGISSGWYVTQYGMCSCGANCRRIILLQCTAVHCNIVPTNKYIAETPDCKEH